MLSERTRDSDGDDLLGQFDAWAASQGLGGAAYLAARRPGVEDWEDETDDWTFSVQLFEAFIPVYRANNSAGYQSFFAFWERETKQRCPQWRGSFLPEVRLSH
mgnify:FL=1